MPDTSPSTAPACDVCSAPTGDGALLCRTHFAQILHLLRQIPDHTETVDRDHRDAADRPTYRDLRDRTGHPIPYQPGPDPITADKTTPGLASELQTTVTRQDKVTVTSGSKTSGEKPLAWNDRASDIHCDLWSTVNAWALAVSRQHEDPRDPLADVSQDLVPVTEWLLRNADTLRLHPEAGEAYRELTDAIQRAWAVIDRPGTRTRFFVGPCPETDEDDVACPGEVWAFIPTSEDKPAMLVCQNDECGAAWNTTQWMRVGGRILQKIAEQKRRGVA